MKHTIQIYLTGLILAGFLVGCEGLGEDDDDFKKAPANNGPTPQVAANKMFTADVMPILNNKCKSCHGSKGRFSVSSASGTYANISDLQNTPKQSAQYLIDKGSNTMNHGGGYVIPTSSIEYATVKSWVDAGADFN